MVDIALQEVATHGFASILPPLLAIGLAIYTRQVFISLAAGIWLGYTILAGWNPAAGAASAIEGPSPRSVTPATRGSSSSPSSSAPSSPRWKRTAGCAVRALGGGSPLGDR